MSLFPHEQAVVEALLLASPEPLPPRRIAAVLGLSEAEAAQVCAALAAHYEQTDRGIRLREVAGGFQLVTRPDLAGYVRELLPARESRLSQAQLETLAVVAYRQPVTRSEIEQVRGVKVDHSLHMLAERGLVRQVGRRDAPGRPILYGTTRAFLLHFGLRDLAALPPLPEAEAPALDEPGLFAMPSGSAPAPARPDADATG